MSNQAKTLCDISSSDTSTANAPLSPSLIESEISLSRVLSSSMFPKSAAKVNGEVTFSNDSLMDVSIESKFIGGISFVSCD